MNKQMKNFKLIREQIKGWKHAGRDLINSRIQTRQDAMEWATHRLNKNKSESKMYDARKKHQSEAEAIIYHENLKKLNPTRYIAHNLYQNGKLIRSLA